MPEPYEGAQAGIVKEEPKPLQTAKIEPGITPGFIAVKGLWLR